MCVVAKSVLESASRQQGTFESKKMVTPDGWH